MKRRGNKSTKVPNVKLRPAQPGSYTRTDSQQTICWAQDTQVDNSDYGKLGYCPRPFKGVVLCATGVIDKPTLFRHAIELGATSTSAFTDRVTHLIAQEHGSAKYMCALERKIPILKPTWVTESYKTWLRGDDVDLAESVEIHRLPIFTGVEISLSGISSITRRTEIHNLLVKNQGVYHTNLERPVRVTHLLCSGDEETDKMRYAEKFNKTGEAKIHMVWEEWFWDSLEFGGRFEEERYQVRQPRPERRTLEEAASSPPPSSAVLSGDGGEESSLNAPRPPTGDDDDEEELANIKRLPEVTLQLWGSLLSKRGYEITNGEVLRSPTKSQPGKNKRKATSPSPVSSSSRMRIDNDVGPRESVISSFRRANSFAPIRSESSGSNRLPFRRTPSNVASSSKIIEQEEAPIQVPEADMNEAPVASPVESAPPRLFSGLRFRALGEAKSPTVENAITNCGGVLESDTSGDVDFIIVRLVGGSKLFQDETDSNLRAKYRTECWLEGCLFQERLCSPDEHTCFLPLSITLPVHDAEKIMLNFSGLDQSEVYWTKRLLRALGITLSQAFSRGTTHLLCPSGSGAKFDKALEWGTPVVKWEWLQEMAQTGSIPPVDAFRVAGSVVFQPKPPVDLKGKGKAKAVVLAEDSMQGIIENGPLVGKGASKQPRGGKPRPAPRRRTAPAVNHELPHLQELGEGEEAISFGEPLPILAPISTPARPRADSVPPAAITKDQPDSPRKHQTAAPASPASTLEYMTRPNSTVTTPQKPRAKSKLNPMHNADDIISSLQRHDYDPFEERERLTAKIPSSSSPSPLKVLSQLDSLGIRGRKDVGGTARRSASLSPVKGDLVVVDSEAAKVLRDSVASLLGKRTMSVIEDEETYDVETGGSNGAGGVDGLAPGGKAERTGKRARPHRSKTMSRQSSNTDVFPQRADDSASPAPSGNGHKRVPSSDDELQLPGRKGDDGGVKYEDPGQREEQKRLISLLKLPSTADLVTGSNGRRRGKGVAVLAVSGDSTESTNGSRRRSTRIAGF